MTEREVRRLAVLSRVAEGPWRLGEAGERRGVSYRPAQRRWKRYRAEGPPGLVPRSAGRASSRAKPRARRRGLRLIRAQYRGEPGKRFGPTLAAEHLASEDGIGVETLRRWMLAEGLWSRERKPRAPRRRRERQAHLGELGQLDGSFPAWREGRGARGGLRNRVDDETGRTLCRIWPAETLGAAAGVLETCIQRYGVPRALYPDGKNVYGREPREEERRGGEAALTQFGRRCRQWGIDIVAASSPPAQGRVERNQGTHQDRLVKKLRRQGISTQAEVNRYLEEYCPEPNARYAVAAAAPADYHLPGPGARRLREIFRLETERVLSHDWVVRHANRFYQGERPRLHHAPAKSRVRGCAWEDGRMEIHYRGQKLKWKEIGGRAEGRKAEDSGPRAGATVARRKWRPGPDHPWRRAYGGQRVAPPPWGRPPRGTLPSLASASASP